MSSVSIKQLNSLGRNFYGDKETKKGLIKSLSIHLIFIIIIFFGDFIFKNLGLDKKRESNLKLIEASVRVDMVAMPKLTIKELRNMELTVPSASNKIKETPENIATPPPPQILEDKSQLELEQQATKKINVMDMLKKMAQESDGQNGKKKKKEKASKGKDIDVNEQKKLQELVMAGNKLRVGSALTGDVNEANQGEFELYLSKLPELVRPHWILPSYLANRDLRCRIRIFLNSSGGIIRLVVHESSGEQEFDNRAMRAIKETAPFPVVSDSFRGRVGRGEILLGFPL